MTRGFMVSLALHVAVFAAVMLGPSPKAFEWDPMSPHVVELVAAPIVPPPERPVEPVPTPERPRMKPPVNEKVPEVEPPVSEPPVEAARPDPAPVRQKTKPPRPPRRFQRVAPKRPADEPSLAERLEERLESVGSQEVPADAASEDSVRVDAELAAEASTEVEALDFPFAWYLRQVQTRVHDAWDTPGDRLIAGRDRPVTVEFVIHRDGRVSGVRVEASSGTPGLDASALRAVERAQPFPPLPDPYEGEDLALAVRFHVAGGSS